MDGQQPQQGQEIVIEAGDRVKVTSKGKHENARGVVQAVGEDKVTVRLNRPRGRLYVDEFEPAELEKLA